MKKSIQYLLLAIGFIALFINPAENSESWYSGMLITKLVSAISFGICYLIHCFENYISGN